MLLRHPLVAMRSRLKRGELMLYLSSMNINEYICSLVRCLDVQVFACSIPRYIINALNETNV
jgi:hypothetical protein